MPKHHAQRHAGKRRIARLTLALLPLLHAAQAQTATVTWVGPGSGQNWFLASNWSGGVFPTATDDVILGSSNVVIYGNVAGVASSVTGTGMLSVYNGLTLSADSFLGGLDLTALGSPTMSFRSNANTLISGPLLWAGGNILGRGTTRVQGAATLDLTRGIGNLGPGHTLALDGTTRMLSSINGSASNGQVGVVGARIVNGGAWVDQAASNISFTNVIADLEPGRFDNQGSFVKESASSTTFERGVLFHNTGSVQVNAGTLRLAGGGTSSGRFHVAEGASLVFGSGLPGGNRLGFIFDAGLTSAGAVTVEFDSAVSAAQGLQFSGRTVVKGGLTLGGSSSMTHLILEGGVGTLSPATELVVTERLEWTGSFSGPGRTRATGEVMLGYGSKSLASGHQLITAGTTRVTLPGAVRMAQGSGIRNLGTWTDEALGDVFFTGGRFDNEGVFNKTTDTRTVMSGDSGNPLVFNNTGETNIQAGRLKLNSAFNNQGLIQVASGATLEGNHASFGNAGTLAGSGTVIALEALANTGTLAPGGVGQVGQLNLQGGLEQSGTLLVDVASSGADLLAVSGNVNLGGTLSFAVLAGQRVSRGSSFTIMNWGQRTPGSEFTRLDFSQASGHRFATVYGAEGLTVTVTSTPFIWAGPATGGFWDPTQNWNDGADGRPGAGDTVFLGSANTTIRRGQVDTMRAATVIGTGALTINSGATLDVSENARIGGLSVSGVLVNTGRVDITGSGTLSGGTLSGSGTTRYEGALLIQGNTSFVASGHSLEMAGNTTVQGNSSTGLLLGNGARVVNQGAWVEAASVNSSLSGNGGTSSFDNQGSFTKTGAATTTTIGGFGLSFNNSGSVNVEAGTLRLTASGASTGQMRIASGATLDFAVQGAGFDLSRDVSNAGTFQIRAGTVNAGQGLELGGSTVISGGRLNLGGSSRFEHLDFVGSGRLDNNGSLVVTGPTAWGGSTFAGTGTTRLEGPLSLAGASTSNFTSGTLVLAGTTTQTGTGSININGGSAHLVNEGSWLDQAGGNVSIGGASARFDNSGRYIKTGSFTTAIGSFGLAFKNTGMVDVQAGKLQVAEGFNNQGEVKVAAGAELQGTVGNFVNAGILSGDGTVRAADRLSNAGTLAAGGLDDAGTLTLIGGLTQQAGGIFLVDLGGTAAGSFDLLSVSGIASLGGTLAVNLLQGAKFNVGDGFTVMSWGQRLNNSQFASLDLSHAGGYEFATEYGANSLTLRVMTAPVPEPSSWALMTLGLLGMGLWARRRAIARQ